MRNPEPRISQNLVPATEGGASRWVHEVACHDCCICATPNRVLPSDLEDFTANILVANGVPASEARLVARNLVAADERGIPSHGVARLGRYLSGIKQKTIRPGVEMTVVEPAPALAVVDAHNGLGQVAGELGIRLAIDKAMAHGISAVTVKHSNHYGIAGFYALQAVDEGMIGISLTNSAPLVVPTFGAEMVLGTNPISLGAPCRRFPAFLLDMATSVVPRGKIEVYDRAAKQMPVGWAVDEIGYDCQNPGQVLRNLIERTGGGILPLGGRGEEYGGYKGYGLSLMVDILCGVLSGAGYGPNVDDVHGNPAAGTTAFPDVGHFFAVIDIARFMPVDEFTARMDDYIERLKGSRKALGEETIFVHGEKEWAKTLVHREVGIPLAENVFGTLSKLGEAVGVPAMVVQPVHEPCDFAPHTPGGGDA
ncbi:MAG: Ldh family oxidoreductase [Thermoanaerobaculaceae bacterium]|nr:Ldh family oxidoreductase [Thermoanaerobaculaceae bacterium]MDI9622270.1 Ldh family oxidoreductase [Acidobacteriota bacterium]NLH11887.1 Ldh family oxidoreductase [Holophagae bacterium]HPW56322.1 Ldh family oxidoreductase [Thermoanaerobaculaceae bacterium]